MSIRVALMMIESVGKSADDAACEFRHFFAICSLRSPLINPNLNLEHIGKLLVPTGNKLKRIILFLPCAFIPPPSKQNEQGKKSGLEIERKKIYDGCTASATHLLPYAIITLSVNPSKATNLQQIWNVIRCAKNETLNML